MKRNLDWLLPTFLLVSSIGAGAGLACSGTEAAPCQPDYPRAQATKRFVAGATFWLPQSSTSPNSCPGYTWELTSAPAGNEAVIHRGDDGFDRLTPIVAGDYVFRARDTEVTQTLTVLASDSAPFEHHHYYPSTSIAFVGEEIWVTDVFDPHITRIDAQTHAVIGQVLVGPWPVALAHRAGMKYALVAQRGGDTVGFVDVAKGGLVDSVWVGDEPAEIVVSPDGTLAYVALATEDAIAVVDVNKRSMVAKIATNSNPMAMAMTDDGGTLYVASYRSGIADRMDYPADPRSDLYDIVIVDTQSRKVTGTIESVGSNINAMILNQGKLYVATTRSVPKDLTLNVGMTAFRHTVAVYDLQTKKEIVSADLGRQASSKGYAVRAYGLSLSNSLLWVAIEGSDLALGLDPTTLEEKVRAAAPGRPRALVAKNGAVAVHGAQGYRVTFLDETGAEKAKTDIGGDPRSASVALGQALYSGVGEEAGLNHSCTDCHVDGLTDGNVWNAGVFKYQVTSRPLFYMEGTHPIGWEADGADLYSYLYGSPGPTISKAIDNTSHKAFFDFMASVVPPPPSNGKTKRDGSMTDAALRGKTIFETKALCASCHSGPLTTNRQRNPSGTLPEPTDTPSLIGSYRHSFWLLNGAARTLEEAVDAMLPLSGNPKLTASEKADLVRYVEELSAREFFVLGTFPENGAEHVPADTRIMLDFSLPIFNDSNNLRKVVVRASTGELVDVATTTSERKIVLQPKTPLVPGKTYNVEVGSGFEAFGEQRTAAKHLLKFTTAGVPSLSLEGDYLLTVKRPGLDFQNQQYDYNVIIDLTMKVKATKTPFGATVVSDLVENLTTTYDVAIEGKTSYWPALMFASGPRLIGKTFPTSSELVDADNDGIADSGKGTLFFRSPGLEAKDVTWILERPTVGPSLCEGTTGTHMIAVTKTPGGLPIMSWQGPEALGYYVTEPSAVLPLGPGTVKGGKSFWVLQTTSFPQGFVSPVTYGILPDKAADKTVENGGMLGGSPLPVGQCLKFSVQYTDFSTSTVLMTWQ